MPLIAVDMVYLKDCSAIIDIMGRGKDRRPRKRSFRPIEERFWEKVKKTDTCWLWTGALDNHGYGRIYSKVNEKDRAMHASRVSYGLHFGPFDKTLDVLHHCDNPPCVNPAHLFLGRQEENMWDKSQKGRQLSGEKHGGAKLTDSEVSEIRRLYALGGHTQQKLADLFGVCNQAVSLIVNHKRRKS